MPPLDARVVEELPVLRLRSLPSHALLGSIDETVDGEGEADVACRDRAPMASPAAYDATSNAMTALRRAKDDATDIEVSPVEISCSSVRSSCSAVLLFCARLVKTGHRDVACPGTATSRAGLHRLHRSTGTIDRPRECASAARRTGMASTLLQERLHVLSSRFRGDLIGPDSDSYESARKVWNGMIDKRPAVILRCKSIADVQSAVRFAARERAAARDSRRRPQCGGARDVRRRRRRRPERNARRRRRSGTSHRARRRRSDVGRLRSRHGAIWPRDDRRRHLDDGHRRTHPRAVDSGG